jgi:hypothetical protein
MLPPPFQIAMASSGVDPGPNTAPGGHVEQNVGIQAAASCFAQPPSATREHAERDERSVPSDGDRADLDEDGVHVCLLTQSS